MGSLDFGYEAFCSENRQIVDIEVDIKGKYRSSQKVLLLILSLILNESYCEVALRNNNPLSKKHPMINIVSIQHGAS